MEYLILSLVAFLASGLTFFSGFGLGTILVPVFGLFFSIDLAIALTAIVHFLNNLFKLVLLGKQIHWLTVARFGLPSALAAFIGAWLLGRMSTSTPLWMYQIDQTPHYISILKLVIAALLIFFALFDIVPSLKRIQFGSQYMPLGGVLSGFFGGLSGNQGALRSAFLVKAGLSTAQFIATGTFIACIIDVARLSVYADDALSVAATGNITLLLCATLAAFAGAYAGNRLIKKVTLHWLQNFVAVALIIFALLLGSGII